MTKSILCWLAGLSAALACGVRTAHAGADKPSGLLVFPRIEVDTAHGVDTLVQISNHGMNPAGVLCFYVSALGACSNAGTTVCRDDAECPMGGQCIERCEEIDFIFNLTRGQTLGFAASQGAMPPTLDISPGSIPPTHTDPFLGELKCVQVDPTTNAPVAGNDLLGTATLLQTATADAAGYNAIGIESTGRNDGDGTLCLGSNATGDCQSAEYVRCPLALDLDHFFEGATVAGAQIENELTLVPCSQALGQPPPIPTTVDVTVFNEFEERRCTTFSIGCVADIRFADHPIFAIGMQGTLAGHTRIQGPIGSEDDVGHALLGMALERHVAGGVQHSAAHQPSPRITAVQADFIHFTLPPPLRLRRVGAGGRASVKPAIPTTFSRQDMR